jgi:hypothetical protein
MTLIRNKGAAIALLLFIHSTSLSSQSAFSACLPAALSEESGFADSTGMYGGQGEVRPFITDDARVVGGRLAQLESWCRIDEASGQKWFMLAYGPSDHLELAAGGVLGYEVPEEGRYSFSYALPLLQAKYLFREYAPNRPPGVGVVVGTFLPRGERRLSAARLRNLWLPHRFAVLWSG